MRDLIRIAHIRLVVKRPIFEVMPLCAHGNAHIVSSALLSHLSSALLTFFFISLFFILSFFYLSFRKWKSLKKILFIFLFVWIRINIRSRRNFFFGDSWSTQLIDIDGTTRWLKQIESKGKVPAGTSTTRPRRE